MAQGNSEDRFGMTPLMYAVSCGDAKAASALIKAGASVHKEESSGRNLIDSVGRLPPNSCATILHLLLTAGANAVGSFPSGSTPRYLYCNIRRHFRKAGICNKPASCKIFVGYYG